MEVRVSGLRRAAKNIAHNYTEPQKKVREATSNDPWGPSSTIMGEISDLTYNIEAFAQIMEMLWKRLNDSGKNWRHVYKALVLLEYLIKTGSERVAQQCKENIFAIQTLKDFEYYEDNKDQGLNVKEKAKQLVILLSSAEKLRTERARALKARERFAQTASGFGSSDSNETSPTSPGLHPFGRSGNSEGGFHTAISSRNPEIESARPHSHGEEELQLQLALAMSKEEAEQEEKQRRSDELRLQMALSQSEQEFKIAPAPKSECSLVDLLDVDLGTGAAALPPPVVGFLPSGSGAASADPWGVSPPQQSKQSAPWTNNLNNSGMNSNNFNSTRSDPWNNSPPNPVNSDPWNSKPIGISAPVNDPWAPKAAGGDEDEFNNLSRRTGDNGTTLSPLGMSVSPNSAAIRNPADFLGENSVLVNLNNLLPITTTAPAAPAIFGSSPIMSNPFGLMTSTTPAPPQPPVNPFHLQNNIAKPSINEIRQKQQLLQTQNNLGGIGLSGGAVQSQNNPWLPVGK